MSVTGPARVLYLRVGWPLGESSKRVSERSIHLEYGFSTDLLARAQAVWIADVRALRGPTLRLSHTALHGMARRNLRPRTREYLDSVARSEFRAHGRKKGQDRLQAMGFAWTCAARMLIASGALIQGLVFGGRRAGARESKRRGIGCVKGELVVFADLCARFWATMHASVALSERNTGPGHVCHNPRPLGSEGPTLRRSHTALHTKHGGVGAPGNVFSVDGNARGDAPDTFLN